MSSIAKGMRNSNLSNTRNAVDQGQSSKLRGESNISMLPNINIPGRDSGRDYALSPSVMHVQRHKQSALAKQESRGALTIMNVTFNDETIKKSRFNRGKAGDVKEKQPFGATAFHIASKKRIKRIQQLNEEMKQSVLAEVPSSPTRAKAKDSPQMNQNKNDGGMTPNESGMNTVTSKFKDKDMANISERNTSPLNSLQIQGNPNWRQDQRKSGKQDESWKPSKIKISLQPNLQTINAMRVESQLQIQGKEATLEPRLESVHSKPLLESQVSVKVLIQSKPTVKQELMGDLGRTYQGLDLEEGLKGALSSQSVDHVAEDIKSMLEDELLDDDEQPSPLKINKPTLQHTSQSRLAPSKNSSKQLLQTPMKARKASITPSKASNLNLKRKSALEKTNGGVEPWGSKISTSKKKQSILSFAELQNDSDDDKGPVVKEPDSNIFILNKDASVQQIHQAQHVTVRSSVGDDSVPKATSNAHITNISSKKA